jgi:hypothetical protein
VGVPVPLTVAVKVTGWLVTEGFAEETTVVVLGELPCSLATL